jgi:aspartyl-tRNA(Asn)/glutamyl-tRNA(Gln) amidotransferase subunit C
MDLSEQDIRVIATNARIGLSDEEVTSMTGYLNSVIKSLKPITEYDLDGIEPTFHPIAGLVNIMRDDVIEPGLTLEEALANTSSHQGGQFLVPQILGAGGGR